jgi:hypothetical protein
MKQYIDSVKVEDLNIDNNVKALCLLALNKTKNCIVAASLLKVCPRTLSHYVKKFGLQKTSQGWKAIELKKHKHVNI